MFHINIIGFGVVGKATLNHIFSHCKLKHNKLDITLIDSEEVLEDALNHILSKRVIQRLGCKIKTTENFISSYKHKKDKKQIYIICIPTNYNYCMDSLDMNNLNWYLKFLKDEYVIVRSTLSLVYADELLINNQLAYVPEFLRENKIRADSHNPINFIGVNSSIKETSNLRISKIVNMLFKTDKLVTTDIKTATTIKLATNAYLSTRLVFFNQLNKLKDTYNLDSNIIEILCNNDSRIGSSYNEEPYLPLGKCLPKDTKTLYNDSKNMWGDSCMSILERVLQYQ